MQQNLFFIRNLYKGGEKTMFSCKKLFITILSATLVLCNTPATMYAQTINDGITPYYEIVRRAEALLCINNGSAKITIKIVNNINATQSDIVYSIQKFNDGKWKDIKTWNKSINNTFVTISNSYDLPSKGKYRIKCNANIRNIDKTEEITFFSDEKTYL